MAPEYARVFVDPAVAKVLMPDQLRSTAAGLLRAQRGTRLPLGDGAVPRMFVHWRQPCWPSLSVPTTASFRMPT